MIGIIETFKDQSPRDFPPLITERVFSSEGWLTSILGLEYRPQQEQMALSCAQAFVIDRPLLFEAGTGVGKSLAYLIPAIIHAIQRKRKCIVSTHTISLQEQIQVKDLVICRRLFEAVPELTAYQDFKTALLVGRANYLCGSRLRQAISTKFDLFPGHEQDDMERIVQWADISENGLRHELDPSPLPEVWDWVNADSAACNHRNCTPQTCFFQKARARMRAAQLIIVNHSLLFSLINAGHTPNAKSAGILFTGDFAVIDEAHKVPAVAAEHFGHRISAVGLDRMLKRLYNPRRGKGLLTRYGSPRNCNAVKKVIDEAESFFTNVRRRIPASDSLLRLRLQNWCESTLNRPLLNIEKMVADTAGGMDESPARDELRDVKTKLGAYRAAINACISLDEEDHVYWIEKTGRRGRNIVMRATPIDVAPYLRERLFDRRTAVVLTSASLAEGPTMESFMDKVGATGEENDRVGSPFDYETNLRVYVADDAPPPSLAEARLDIDYLADAIEYCVPQIDGGTLVLFTSYADMQKVASLSEPRFLASGRPFFMQSRTGSRTELTRCFAEAGNGILFGTESFWTGVDIPGPALSQVIITRLPFVNPSHPIAEAKCEWLQARGINPFLHFTLPDAIIRFRQGVGRLIRKKTDRGIVTILDSRVLHKQYGRGFLEVLPKEKFTRFSRTDRDSVFIRPFSETS